MARVDRWMWHADPIFRRPLYAQHPADSIPKSTFLLPPRSIGFGQSPVVWFRLGWLWQVTVAIGHCPGRVLPGVMGDGSGADL